MGNGEWSIFLPSQVLYPVLSSGSIEACRTPKRHRESAFGRGDFSKTDVILRRTGSIASVSSASLFSWQESLRRRDRSGGKTIVGAIALKFRVPSVLPKF